MENAKYTSIHIGIDEETKAILKILADFNRVSMSKMVKMLITWAYHSGHFGLTDKDKKRFAKLVRKHKEDLI